MLELAHPIDHALEGSLLNMRRAILIVASSSESVTV